MTAGSLLSQRALSNKGGPTPHAFHQVAACQRAPARSPRVAADPRAPGGQPPGGAAGTRSARQQSRARGRDAARPQRQRPYGRADAQLGPGRQCRALRIEDPTQRGEAYPNRPTQGPGPGCRGPGKAGEIPPRLPGTQINERLVMAAAPAPSIIFAHPPTPKSMSSSLAPTKLDPRRGVSHSAARAEEVGRASQAQALRGRSGAG
jgi:hypothetical protein